MSIPSEPQKGRRVSIDLTAAAAAEVDRLRAVTELNTADLFRHALHLFRIYVDQRAHGNSLFFADPRDPERQLVQVEMPLIVPVLMEQPRSGAVKSRPV